MPSSRWLYGVTRDYLVEYARKLYRLGSKYNRSAGVGGFYCLSLTTRSAFMVWGVVLSALYGTESCNRPLFVVTLGLGLSNAVDGIIVFFLCGSLIQNTLDSRGASKLNMLVSTVMTTLLQGLQCLSMVAVVVFSIFGVVILFADYGDCMDEASSLLHAARVYVLTLLGVESFVFCCVSPCFMLHYTPHTAVAAVHTYRHPPDPGTITIVGENHLEASNDLEDP